MALGANIGLQRVETTEEESIQRRQESLVRSGQTPSHMTISSPMWAITTTAGTQLVQMMCKFGAWPMIPLLCLGAKHVQFPFALLSRSSTSHWTTTGNPTPTTVTPTPLFGRKTFLLRLPYALPLWWNTGRVITHHCSSSVTATITHGCMLNFMLLEATLNSLSV